MPCDIIQGSMALSLCYCLYISFDDKKNLVNQDENYCVSCSKFQLM